LRFHHLYTFFISPRENLVVTAALYASGSISTITGYSLFGKAQVGDNSTGSWGDPELIVGNQADSAAIHTCWDSTPANFDTGARPVQLTANPGGGANGVKLQLVDSPSVSQTFSQAQYGALGDVYFRAGVTVPGLVQWSSIGIQWYKNGQVVDSYLNRFGPKVDDRGAQGPLEGEEVLAVSTSVHDADKVVAWGRVEIAYQSGVYPAPDDLFGEIFVFPVA
jgi:hypothetical protein